MFSLLKLANLVPAESSVIESFKMLLIKFNSFRVILDGILIISLLSVSEPPIVIKVGFGCF